MPFLHHNPGPSLLSLVLIAVLGISLGSNVALAEDDKVERVKKMLDSDNYAVAWDDTKALSPDSELEIGNAHGHGMNLRWVRFKPMKNKVDVIQIEYVVGEYASGAKRPEDRAKIEIKATQMDTKVYAQLLDDISVVNSAITRPSGESFRSTLNYWVHARVIKDGKKLVNLDHCDYLTSASAYRLAKPTVAVRLVDEALEKLQLRTHTLSDAEKDWASDRFIDLWNTHHANDKYSWVCSRALDLTGYVGNKQALPTLKKILQDKTSDAFAYECINAATRLTGKDVRDKPVEKMDLKANRDKVLQLLKDIK